MHHHWALWAVDHDDISKWKHFPCYWPVVRGFHRWSVNSPHKGPVTRKMIPFHHVILPHKEPVMWSFDISFVISINMLLNKQSGRVTWNAMMLMWPHSNGKETLSSMWKLLYSTMTSHERLLCITSPSLWNSCMETIERCVDFTNGICKIAPYCLGINVLNSRLYHAFGIGEMQWNIIW